MERKMEIVYFFSTSFQSFVVIEQNEGKSNNNNIQ